MFELIVSLPAALLRFKDLKAVSNSSVVKSELFMASLKDQIFCKLIETGGILFIRKDLHS